MPGGPAIRHEEDFDGDGDLDLVFHFRFRDTGYTCSEPNPVLGGYTFDGQPFLSTDSSQFNRDFAIGQDWAFGEALRFWYYGTDSGEEIVFTLKDNRAPDPGPTGWNLAWSDEFDDPAGTAPNPSYWSYEIGDGAANRIPGWGNQELQYYTSSTENSATDGNGNLVITLREASGGEQCYYGDCDYTSARLISQYKAEFAYGRIESRILVPDGDAGLWPAFWSLGTDIAEVGWPQTGEIDFMEYVSRLPTEIFGTIHGPGYSGGLSYGNIYNFNQPVSDQYHTFAVEWEPNSIKWYVDDILYHTAVPADVSPNQWVFNDPVFLIFNMAIGGNFGGAVSPNLTFPQEMKVDYVRVYQGPDTAERFETTFSDNFSGWQEVVVPFSSLVRSADQPVGAPNDGLGLSEVWGFGLELPNGIGAQLFDQFRLDIAPPSDIVVTNLNDSGSGSLRKALADIAAGGTITFDPALAGGTINLASGPLIPSRDVTVDAVDAPGLALDGGGIDRILIVDAGVTATFANLTMQNGYGFQLAGGVLNNGSLTLDHVIVTGNTMTTPDTGQFWQGGGGIYNGEFATLDLIDSTVSNNDSGWAGGGVFAMFNTQINIVRSTISGNTAVDVGGGLRVLGNGDIVNSTISGNTAIGWHGGGLFLTDGVLNITNSTIVGNNAPGGTAGGIFTGTFTDASATLNIQNSIVADNGDFGCFLAPFGAGAVAINSLGNNLFTDGSCFPVASDLIVASSGLDALADNGGPTLTHALLAGSPALDAANAAACPATDQRGVTRPQGPGCDIGAFELAVP
jgi:beta-glucanase (GH16 family)